MNHGYEHLNQNKYEGNGWSKYQLMVLQQLNDHNSVLHNLNKDIIDIKQETAVSDAELKMWKTQLLVDLSELKRDTQHILYNENGINSRLAKMERELDIEEQANTKHKATLALYGSIIVFIANVIFQVVSLVLKFK